MHDHARLVGVHPARRHGGPGQLEPLVQCLRQPDVGGHRGAHLACRVGDPARGRRGPARPHVALVRRGEQPQAQLRQGRGEAVQLEQRGPLLRRAHRPRRRGGDPLERPQRRAGETAITWSRVSSPGGVGVVLMDRTYVRTGRVAGHVLEPADRPTGLRPVDVSWPEGRAPERPSAPVGRRFGTNGSSGRAVGHFATGAGGVRVEAVAASRGSECGGEAGRQGSRGHRWGAGHRGLDRPPVRRGGGDGGDRRPSRERGEGAGRRAR